MVGDDPLTPHEVAQQALQLATNAVYDYTGTSAAAATHLTALGVDVEAMAESGQVIVKVDPDSPLAGSPSALRG